MLRTNHKPPETEEIKDLEEFFDRRVEIINSELPRLRGSFDLPRAKCECCLNITDGESYAFEFSALRPTSNINYPHVSFGSHKVTGSKSSREKGPYLRDRPLTILTDIVENIPGYLASLESYSYVAMTNVTDTIAYILGIVAQKKSESKKWFSKLNLRFKSLHPREGRSFLSEYLQNRNVTDLESRNLIVYLSHSLSRWGYTEVLEDAVPKNVKEKVKTFSRRVFYIVMWGVLCLSISADLLFRMLGRKMNQNTFGENKAGLVRKELEDLDMGKEYVKDGDGADVNIADINVIVDIKGFSNRNPGDTRLNTCKEYLDNNIASGTEELQMAGGLVKQPVQQLTTLRSCKVLGKKGASEGQDVKGMQPSTDSTVEAFCAHLIQCNPLKDIGLEVYHISRNISDRKSASDRTQSDDAVVKLRLRIIDIHKLRPFPVLRKRILDILKECGARSGQVINMIKSDVTPTAWQIADKTNVMGSQTTLARSSNSISSAYREALLQTDFLAARRGLGAVQDDVTGETGSSTTSYNQVMLFKAFRTIRDFGQYPAEVIYLAENIPLEMGGGGMAYRGMGNQGGKDSPSFACLDSLIHRLQKGLVTGSIKEDRMMLRTLSIYTSQSTKQGNSKLGQNVRMSHVDLVRDVDPSNLRVIKGYERMGTELSPDDKSMLNESPGIQSSRLLKQWLSHHKKLHPLVKEALNLCTPHASFAKRKESLIDPFRKKLKYSDEDGFRKSIRKAKITFDVTMAMLASAFKVVNKFRNKAGIKKLKVMCGEEENESDDDPTKSKPAGYKTKEAVSERARG